MAPFFGIIVTLCGLTGTHGITTVSVGVSVEVGATVSIPCLYELSHKNHVKYLCKGMDWRSCSVEIKTKSESSSPEGLYTISDYPNQGVFTVTIKSQKEGTQYYWCAVDMGIWPDEKTDFKLEVSKGKSSLYLDQQEITGFAGDSINIIFHSKTHGKPGWCKLGHYKEPQDGFIEGSQCSIDARKQGVFVVTMKDLDMENSGWYIFFQGKLNMPIHLTVAVNSKTTNTPTSTTVSTLSDVSTKKITEKEPEHVLRDDLKNLLLPLGILLFIISVALLVLWMFHRRAKRKLTAITVSSETDVVYSSVMPMHSRAAQNKPTGDMNLKKNPKEDGNITYSVIGPHPRI
ncbi:uncharacterized protein LOC130404763 [Gadus chalcogrammus]|uniref:uncharacterized protein LOC130404763 n=1 Tax=Gadus chalcogrammus TaxID=1042646 RepID=UPI0024C47439|nr:uncharacterized protein LOC130404763 [Gadus chalcogrammus]